MTEPKSPDSAAKPSEPASGKRRSRGGIAFWTVIAALQIPLLFFCGFRAIVGTIVRPFGVQIIERSVESSSSCPRWRRPSIGSPCPDSGARCRYRGWSDVGAFGGEFICRERRWDHARDGDTVILSL